MPDKFGFDHLANQGVEFHRCVECGYPDRQARVPEADRRKHHDSHVRARAAEVERTRRLNVAKARAAKAQIPRHEGDA